MNNNFDIVLAITSHRGLSPPTANSFEKMRLVQRQLGFTYSVALFVGDALLSRARSQACTKFLEETKAPYMLFIDDDIVFEPEHVAKIYHHLASKQYDLIGGIYPVSGASQLSSYGWGGKLTPDGSVQEIEFLATGFMGISRTLLEKMIAELKLPILNANDWARDYPFFECGRFENRERGGEPIYISEDWDFSMKARKVGVKVYADTSVQVDHQREKVYSVKDVQLNQAKAAMDAQLYGAMNHQFNLMQKVNDDLSEFLHMAPGRVQEAIEHGQERLAKEWEEWKGEPTDFYKDNITSLFDLAVFNQQQYYFEQRLGALIQIGGAKILDIGCGIGTAVFTLAEHNNEVTGWDINQKAIAFARFKKEKHKLGGEFTMEQPDFSKFDLIVAIDMLEHIPDLQGFLLNLGKNVKVGAKFYHSDFFPKGEKNTWPMHYEEHQQHLSQWLKEAGFVEWDDKWCVRV